METWQKNKNAVFSPSCRFLAAAAANFGGRFFNRQIVSGRGHTGGLFIGQVIVEQVKQCNRTSSGAYPAGQCLLVNVSCDHLKAVFYELEFQSSMEAPSVSEKGMTLVWLCFSFAPDKRALTKLGFFTFLIQQDKGSQKKNQQAKKKKNYIELQGHRSTF